MRLQQAAPQEELQPGSADWEFKLLKELPRQHLSCAGNLDRLKGRMGSLTLRLTLSLRAHSFSLRGWFVVERAYARLTPEHCTQISTPLQEKSLREDEFIAG